MTRLRLLALGFSLLTFPCALAGAALAGDEPIPVAGASYEFTASAGVDTAGGRGELDLDGSFAAKVRVSSRGGGEAVTIRARVSRFNLAFLLPRKKLVLAVEVTSGPSGCPKGTRGTVTLVDDEGGDSVRARFRRTGCSAFARAWASAAPGQFVRVEISVRYGKG